MVIDVDKFVASLIKYYCEAYFVDRASIRCWFDDVLEDQGLEYKDGDIVKTQRRVAAEAKEALYTAEVETGDGGIKAVVTKEVSIKSEDEESKRWILEYLYDGLRKSDEQFKGQFKAAIAWLEKQGNKDKLTHEDICKAYNIPDIGEFSDGYHTFNGLYKQRMILFAVLVKTYKDRAWKSWKHEDGLDCFGGGWFIVGIDTPDGTYTYHYEAKDWDRFDCQILEKAKHWDGHDEFDVERLFSLVSNDNKYAEWASLEYRKFREECGIKDPVMLDEIEEAYYNGATSIQKPAWSDEDSKMFDACCDFLTDEECVWLQSLRTRLGGK